MDEWYISMQKKPKYPNYFEKQPLKTYSYLSIAARQTCINELWKSVLLNIWNMKTVSNLSILFVFSIQISGFCIEKSDEKAWKRHINGKINLVAAEI